MPKRKLDECGSDGATTEESDDSNSAASSSCDSNAGKADGRGSNDGSCFAGGCHDHPPLAAAEAGQFCHSPIHKSHHGAALFLDPVTVFN